MKEQVDSFKAGKQIPACHLQTIPTAYMFTDLHHIVNLNGAKDPFNIFTIYRHYDSYKGES